MKTKAIFGIILITTLIWIGCATEEDSITGEVGKSGTQISGDLTGTLSAASSPYWVTGDLRIPTGENLTIEPGVELRFDGLYKFVVQGHLDAVGTAEENIVFTSMEGALGNGDFGQWRALVFDTGSDISELIFCRIQYAAVWDSSERYPVYPDSSQEVGWWLNGAIFLWNCSPFIGNCTVLKNGYHGIYCIGSETNPYILNNNIFENDGDGIRCEEDATAQVWYNNSRENNARQFAECPDGIGDLTRLNAVRDSCDFQYNIKLDPGFTDFVNYDYTITSLSHLIGAGKDTLGSDGMIGSMPYNIGLTELRGPIGGKVLTADLSPWYVSNNCFVEPGETLESEPGTEVLFYDNDVYYMRLAGTFRFEGTTFMSIDSTSTAFKWDGLMVVDEADPGSYIRDCSFIRASTTAPEAPFGGAITLYGVSPEISGNTFTDCEFAAVSCQNGSAPEIMDNIFDGFGTMAILCHNNSHPHIYHNVIRDGAGYAILCNANSSPTIESNLIYNTDLIGIKCNANSSPQIIYNTIVDHKYTGIQIDMQSNPFIRGNIIAFNGNQDTWSSLSPNGSIQTRMPTGNSYNELVLEFDMYRRNPSTDQQISRIGISTDSWDDQTGFYIELEDLTSLSTCWNGSESAEVVIDPFDANWYHVVMERSSDGSWIVTWDTGGANETTIAGQDQFGELGEDLYIWIEGEPYINTAHYDNFSLTVDGDEVWSDDFTDGNYTVNPTWEVIGGISEIANVGGFCLLTRGADVYGNGIDVNDEYSSFPAITFNDVYQPEDQGYPFGGVTPGNSNIQVDPQFEDMDNADFHLQAGSACLTAGPDDGEIGAYGQGDW